MYFNYTDVTYHAISKQEGYIMLQLNKNLSGLLSNEDNLYFKYKGERLFIYPQDKQEGNIILIYSYPNI